MENTEIFNEADLLDTFMEDAEKAKSLLSQFIERTSGQLQELPGLAESKNWQDAHRITHTIKGAARMLAGLELGDAAEKLEKGYKMAELTKIEAAYPALVKAFEQYKEATAVFLSR